MHVHYVPSLQKVGAAPGASCLSVTVNFCHPSTLRFPSVAVAPPPEQMEYSPQYFFVQWTQKYFHTMGSLCAGTHFSWLMEDKVGLGGGRVLIRDSGDLRPLQDVNVFPDLHNQLALLPQPFGQSCRLSTHPCVALTEGSTRSSYILHLPQTQ